MSKTPILDSLGIGATVLEEPQTPILDVILPTPPSNIFDPESSGYDDATAQRFIESHPLTIPKPKKYQGDYIKQPDAYQAWVWHPERNDYVKHSGSLDPKTGMVLKGRKHPTWGLMAEEEKRLGNEIIKKNGRYFSVPADKRSSFDEPLPPSQTPILDAILPKEQVPIEAPITQPSQAPIEPVSFETPTIADPKGLPILDEAKERPERGTIGDIIDDIKTIGEAAKIIIDQPVPKGEISSRLKNMITRALSPLALIMPGVSRRGLIEELDKEAETFTGFGPALVPAGGQAAELAVEWFTFQKLFGLTHKGFSALGKIQRVKQLGQAIKNTGSIKAFANKFPRIYAANRDLLRAFAEGETLGQTIGLLEGLDEGETVGNILKIMNIRGATVGAVAAGFSLVSSIDTAIYTRKFRIALTKHVRARTDAQIKRLPKGMADPKAKALITQENLELQQIDNIVAGIEAELIGLKEGKLFREGQAAVESPQAAARRIVEKGIDFSKPAIKGPAALKKQLGRVPKRPLLPTTRAGEVVERVGEIGKAVRQPIKAVQKIAAREFKPPAFQPPKAVIAPIPIAAEPTPEAPAAAPVAEVPAEGIKVPPKAIVEAKPPAEAVTEGKVEEKSLPIPQQHKGKTEFWEGLHRRREAGQAALSQEEELVVQQIRDDSQEFQKALKDYEAVESFTPEGKKAARKVEKLIRDIDIQVSQMPIEEVRKRLPVQARPAEAEAVEKPKIGTKAFAEGKKFELAEKVTPVEGQEIIVTKPSEAITKIPKSPKEIVTESPTIPLKGKEAQIFREEVRTQEKITEAEAGEVGIEPAGVSFTDHIDTFQSYQLPEASQIPRITRQMKKVNGLRLSGKITPAIANKRIHKLRQLLIRQAVKEKIALRTSKKGKVKIALRESGVFVPEEVATYKKYKDIEPILGGGQDITRAIQQMDGSLTVKEKLQTKGQAGPIERFVLWRTRKMSLQKLNWLKEKTIEIRGILSAKKGSKIDKEINVILEKIGTADRDKPIEDILSKDILASVDKKTIKVAQELRQFYDDLIEEQNAARLMRGQDEIPYRQNYSPQILRDTTVWEQLFLRDKTAKVLEKKDLPDYIKPNAPFNPRAQAREGNVPYDKRVLSARELAES